MKIELTIDDKEGIRKRYVELEELPEAIGELKSIFGDIKILPLNTFNSVLKKGQSSNGLSQLISWTPFQINDEQYLRIKSRYFSR